MQQREAGVLNESDIKLALTLDFHIVLTVCMVFYYALLKKQLVRVNTRTAELDVRDNNEIISKDQSRVLLT